jgi:putative FmdB family regulatory protein
MPTYEYVREDGSSFEIIQKFSDEPLTTCPDTGQPVKRIISGGSGVIYKGSGWYITDYKNGNNGKSNSESTGKPAEDGKNQSESTAKVPAGDKQTE